MYLNGELITFANFIPAVISLSLSLFTFPPADGQSLLWPWRKEGVFPWDHQPVPVAAYGRMCEESNCFFVRWKVWEHRWPPGLTERENFIASMYLDIPGMVARSLSSILIEVSKAEKIEHCVLGWVTSWSGCGFVLWLRCILGYCFVDTITFQMSCFRRILLSVRVAGSLLNLKIYW